ncbi:NDxxF motif lipoprotein [Staphylococcus saccharolyticus]|uniref:Lipoprotein n=1 Tax=Staphylococcus saccharolyticus TaxID=33028 RepID=A0A380H923_9STAP|nr:NDxxF motif lipoprotein [Staphylococcus saccharolyticus]MBL7564398.1 NDxxF motif lipoprotein [Staphylococcus saccharolyticus]MBL7571338.1 NDxxF motif lipoprotein [Staphylococcus saccharolyticus]QQB99170.1 NDxxF motif lipoprotein [Staphylococcus saccharolyticus]QRJ66640.1 NDxxF motif lipoprotein [Staphylococcus saccharolyticus]RTX94393.1 NDxxF motif lipoprotein [Staphylococcus saccharolyticus]
MKKRIIACLTLTFSLVLTACSNTSEDNNQDNHSSVLAPKHAKTIKEKDIFTSNKKGQKINEAEMKKALKQYLRVNSDVLDNKYVMQHKLDKQSDSNPKITKSQANKLSELSNLAVKNDLHFKKFVNNNNIPKEYKNPTQRIIKYFHALNSTIANVDEDIEKLNYQPQNSINVVDIPTKYSGDVNKKQQDKITSFLKKKGIDTKVFNK